MNSSENKIIPAPQLLYLIANKQGKVISKIDQRNREDYNNSVNGHYCDSLDFKNYISFFSDTFYGRKEYEPLNFDFHSRPMIFLYTIDIKRERKTGT